MVFGWFKKKTQPTRPASAPSISETELSDEVHARIKELCARGDRHAELEEFAVALPLYWQAFDLLPEPSVDWEAGTWILAAIGDANFLSDDFTAGRDNLTTAMHYPGAVGNAFIHLRLGQCQFELGNLERAADELARACMSAGTQAFAQEHPKYFDFLETKLKPPMSGQW